MLKTALKFLGFLSCLLLLMFCSKEPEIDFGSNFNFDCNSPATICSQPDSLGVFGDDDCDGGGISNILECRNGTDFKSNDDDCAAAIRGNIDICLLIQVDKEDVSKGYQENHVLSQIDCDGGGLTNIEECLNGFNPLKSNDLVELNGRKNDNDIEAYLKKNEYIDDALSIADTVGIIGVLDSVEVIKTESGLIYILEAKGIGEIPIAEDSIEYKHVSSYLDGCTPLSITGEVSDITEVNDLIFGMQEGLSFFPAGSKGKLIIPSRLAYSDRMIEGIPSYSTIIMDIELVAIL